MSDDVLIYEKRDDGVARLTLNRPAALNAINMEMRDALWEALHAVADDPDVRVAVFAGAGERAFSAGADIKEFGTAPSYIEARRARRDRDLWGFMLSMTEPLVAAVHGIAYGAGCELALCCDLRIAADDATFALPEVKLGYIPSAGGTQTLPRTVPPGVAREMILSGEPINAQRALSVGLVSRVVPRGRLEQIGDAVAAQLAALDPALVAAAKTALAQGYGLPLEQALRVDATIAATRDAAH